MDVPAALKPQTNNPCLNYPQLFRAKKRSRPAIPVRRLCEFKK